MSPVVSPDRWTRPDCGYTVVIAAYDDDTGNAIADVQKQHAEAHTQVGQELSPPAPHSETATPAAVLASIHRWSGRLVVPFSARGEVVEASGREVAAGLSGLSTVVPPRRSRRRWVRSRWRRAW